MMNDQIDDDGIYDYSFSMMVIITDMMIMIIVDKLVSSIVIIMMVMIKILVDNLVSALLLLSP